MSIHVKCECGQDFETRDENAGRRARCPECGRELIIPAPKTPGFDDEFAPLHHAPSYTSGKAIASFVLGLSVFLCAFLTGLPAIILGALGISEINRSGGRIKGTGFAITGIILGVLSCTLIPIALLLPAVQAAREAARRAQCTNNMKQIMLAMHNYHDTFGTFPPQATTDADGKPLLSWRVLLLPFLEEVQLYNQFHLDEPWDSPNNRPLLDRLPNVYKCPSEIPNPGMTEYEAVAGQQTMFPGGSGPRSHVRLADVTDGTSNTIAVVESRQPVPWSAPQDLSFATTTPTSGFGSRHPGGGNVAFADGSIRFVKTSILPQVFQALLTRNGGEVVTSDSY